mmetsp:Transcript_7284/g.11489  ORF Transcript_7284/g.11489 Transcript_7284/m.11489 type:complete len:131 (+) Transcript_7284:349-741(+)
MGSSTYSQSYFSYNNYGYPKIGKWSSLFLTNLQYHYILFVGNSRDIIPFHSILEASLTTSNAYCRIIQRLQPPHSSDLPDQSSMLMESSARGEEDVRDSTCTSSSWIDVFGNYVGASMCFKTFGRNGAET